MTESCFEIYRFPRYIFHIRKTGFSRQRDWFSVFKCLIRKELRLKKIWLRLLYI